MSNKLLGGYFCKMVTAIYTAWVVNWTWSKYDCESQVAWCNIMHCNKGTWIWAISCKRRMLLWLKLHFQEIHGIIQLRFLSSMNASKFIIEQRIWIFFNKSGLLSLGSWYTVPISLNAWCGMEEYFRKL